MGVMEDVKSVEGSALQVCETLLMSTSCDMRRNPCLASSRLWELSHLAYNTVQL